MPRELLALVEKINARWKRETANSHSIFRERERTSNDSLSHRSHPLSLTVASDPKNRRLKGNDATLLIKGEKRNTKKVKAKERVTRFAPLQRVN